MATTHFGGFHDAVSSLSSVPHDVMEYDDSELLQPSSKTHQKLKVAFNDDGFGSDDVSSADTDGVDDDAGSDDVSSADTDGVDDDDDGEDTTTVDEDNDIEADGSYTPSQRLLCAANDGKVLWLTYRPYRSLKREPASGSFEILPEAQGTTCTEFACPLQLHAIGHAGTDIFIDIEADAGGVWTASNVPSIPKHERAKRLYHGDDDDFSTTGSSSGSAYTSDSSDDDDGDSEEGVVKRHAITAAGGRVKARSSDVTSITRPSLHLLLDRLRRSGIIYKKATVLSHIEHYIWLPDNDKTSVKRVGARDERRDLRKRRNDDEYAKYLLPAQDDAALLKPTGNKFQIIPSPYRQPHVELSTLRARTKTGRRDKGVREAYGIATYILGFHEATRTWFLTSPSSPLVYVSKSLHALLADGISDDIVVKVRKERSDKGISRKAMANDGASGDGRRKHGHDKHRHRHRHNRREQHPKGRPT